MEEAGPQWHDAGFASLTFSYFFHRRQPRITPISRSGLTPVLSRPFSSAMSMHVARAFPTCFLLACACVCACVRVCSCVRVRPQLRQVHEPSLGKVSGAAGAHREHDAAALTPRAVHARHQGQALLHVRFNLLLLTDAWSQLLAKYHGWKEIDVLHVI